MKRAFKYDAAISATEFDALGVGELSRRLQHRIGKTVYATPQNGDKPQTAATLAAAKKVIEKESRVVVVLFQRLWGTGATAHDSAALKTRIGKLKRKDVIVVPLDNAPIPGWLKGIVVRASGAPTSSAVVDAIVAAVVAAGGSSKRQTDAAVAARAADDDKRAKARTAFLASQRALALINRELDSLSNAVLRLCQTPGTLPPGLAPRNATHARSLHRPARTGRLELLVDPRTLELDRRRTTARDRMERTARGCESDDGVRARDAGVRACAAGTRDESGGLALEAHRSGSCRVHDERSGGAVRDVGREEAFERKADCYERKADCYEWEAGDEREWSYAADGGDGGSPIGAKEREGRTPKLP